MNGRPADLDLATLAARWREEGAPPDVLDGVVRRLRRQTLLMRVVALGELAVGAAFALFTWWAVTRGASAAELVVLAALWAVTLGLAVFAWWNRRGSWRAAGREPSAYLALAERRARAGLRTASVVRWVAGVQAVLVVALVAGDADAGDGRVVAAAAVAGGLAAIYVGWGWWYGRRCRRTLEEVERARGMLGPR